MSNEVQTKQGGANQAAGATGDGGAGGGQGGDDRQESGIKAALSETRRELKTANERHAAAMAELDKLKKTQADADTKRLTEQNEFKTLYEQQQSRAAALEQTLQKLAGERKRDVIRFKVQKEFPALKESYIEKLFPFGSVTVSEDGATLIGIAEAIETFRTEFPEIPGVTAKGAGNGAGGGQGSDKTKGAGAGGGDDPAAKLAEEMRRQQESRGGNRGSAQDLKTKLVDHRSKIGELTAKLFGG